MKYSSFIFTLLLSGFLFLFPVHHTNANCAWVLNNSCSDLGNGFAEKTGSEISLCSASQNVEGSTKKCCCGPEVQGCCLKIQDGKTYSENLTLEQCRTINYATTTFYSDKKAENNSCIDISGSTSTPLKPSPIKSPSLQVSIPGFEKFSDVQCEEVGEGCAIPWLAEYLQAVYRYSLIIIGILAVIVMMIGGIIRTTAGGDKGRISQGNTYIKSSILGVILALCSYSILFLLNPNLTILSPINISYVGRSDLDEIQIDLSKSATENNITETQLTTLKGENPYQNACGDIPKCREYGNQPPSALGLVEVAPEYTTAGKGTQYLKAGVYEALKKVIACYGKNLTVNEGWRSAATQVRYATDPNISGRAAKACCSNHGSGIAMDLRGPNGAKLSWSNNESSGLKKCMNQNGLYANITYMKGAPNGEPWHWSPSGR